MTIYNYAESLTGLATSFPMGLATDGAYVYFGNNLGPIYRFYKANKDTMAVIASVNITALCNPYNSGITSTLIKNGFAYTTVYGAIGCMVIKFRTSDLSVVATYPMAGSGWKIVTDGTYFYIGFYDSPARVVKYDASFNQLAEWIGGAGDDWVWSLIYDAPYIYAGLDVGLPTYVIKLDLNMGFAGRWTSPIDENYVEALSSGDGTFIYAGIWDGATPLGRVKKINIATMTTSASVTLTGSGTEGIGYNNGRVFASCNDPASPGESLINVISAAGMTLDDTLSLASENREILELAFLPSVGVVATTAETAGGAQDSLILFGQEYNTDVGPAVSGVDFIDNRGGLLPNSPYTMWAYGDDGEEIVYSAPVPFTTLADMPLVTTLPATVTP